MDNRVTSAITGDGIYSFGIKNNSSDVAKYSTKDGSQAPELIVEVFIAAVPSITSYTPANGQVGAEVTITGTNFLSTTDVYFNGTPALTYTIDSDTQIRVIVPSGATTGRIAVTNIEGTSQSSTDFTVNNPPVVSSFTPDSGPTGTEVTLTGSNFTGATEVGFNGMLASGFTIDSDLQLLVAVPSGASTGPISVTNIVGTGVSVADFTVLYPPMLTSFTPISGVVGTEVTLIGNNFGGVTNVSFNGTGVSGFIVDSDALLRAIVPAGAITGKISLSNNDGTGESVADFVVIQPPVLSSFIPNNGPVMTEVTLIGSGFTGTTDVLFNGTSASVFTIDSDTQLLATVPSGASTGQISITNDAGTGMSGLDFTITFIPKITSFEPDFGAVGTLVTLTGINFTGMTSVFFNGIASAGFTVDSDTLARTTVPAGATTGKISVTTAFGAGESTANFEVIHPPVVTSFTPTNGPPVTEVTILGGNFVDVSEVSFNGISATIFTIDTETQLRVEVPFGAVTGPVSVMNSAGTATSVDDFTVTVPPSTVSFTPTDDSFGNSGSPNKLYGSSLESRVRKTTTAESISFLKFNVTGLGGPVQNAKLRLKVIDDSNDGGSIYLVSNNYDVTSDPWDEGGLNYNNAPAITGTAFSSLGAVSIDEIVEFDVTAAIVGEGIYSFAIRNNSTNALRYSSKELESATELVVEIVTSPVPSISSFSPVSGVVGSEVTMTGVNFSIATDVSFNGISASSFTVDSDTKIRASVPSGATTGKLSVTNVHGTGLSGTDFTVLNPPLVSSFTPASGPVGTEVTLTGSNFAGATAVSFNGTSASVFTIDSGTQLRANVPSGASTGPISVTNVAGTGVSGSDFTVTFIPGITSFTPENGAVGTSVTISGVNFTGSTNVSFNGTPASGFTIDSDTQLRVEVPFGAITGPLSVTNSAGTGTSVDDFTVTALPSNVTFNPMDDSFVRAAKASNNYGSDDELRIRNPSSGGVNAYLKFNIANLSGTVQNAIIRLKVMDASNDGGAIYSVSNNYEGSNDPWDETGLNFNNAPVITGSSLSSVGAISVGETVEFDVTTAISGEGIFSFAIKNNSTDIAKYSSKEGTDIPELIIEFNSGSGSSSKISDSNFKTTELCEITESYLPERISLSPNYPNPFNIETTIEYALPKNGRVRLGIYNVKGQEVINLVDDNEIAGFKKIKWNGRNNSGKEVGSGVYFIQLRISEKILIRKVTLQK